MAGLLCRDSRFAMSAFVDDVPEARANADGVPGCSFDEFWGGDLYESADLVMVASVNDLHAEHIRRPLRDGKYVFCEKPLFVEWDEGTVADIRANAERFCTGFVLRHAPFYKKIKELMPRIGEVKSGTASDLLHYGHGALIFGGRWRHSKAASGGHVAEKLVHPIDLLVWYLGSPIVAATGMKGPDAWVLGNEAASEEWISRSGNPYLLKAYEFHGSKNPFDHEAGDPDLIASSGILNLRFGTGAVVGMHFDTACQESRRGFFFAGEFGTLQALWSTTDTFVKVTHAGVGTKASKGAPSVSEVFGFESAGCHGGGDEPIIAALKATVLDGATPDPSAEEALLTMKSTLAAQSGLDRSEGPR